MMEIVQLIYAVIGTTIICTFMLLGPLMLAAIIIYLYHIGEKQYERIQHRWKERHSR